ncbi:hypothetical protein J1N35_038335 [Gossypium stocksii]|uniref:Uncharacterized protein n=1 Tax=Gossypium stocksii TaxID=47602 RepID=A0A9D3ZLS3_9ROSI|nr:hypothetical protein J1N35_038335 [Gossypium stocksii]
MNKSRRCFTLSLLLLHFIILSHQILWVVGETGQNQIKNEDKPSFFQVVSNTFSLLKKSHKNSLEKIKTIVHDFRLQFTSSKPDEEAMKTNFEPNKEKVQETEKSTEETLQNTAEKVEDKKESRDEL